jgi:hypothetical protein
VGIDGDELVSAEHAVQEPEETWWFSLHKAACVGVASVNSTVLKKAAAKLG